MKNTTAISLKMKNTPISLNTENNIPRKLTDKEIDYILSFLEVNNSLPKDVIDSTIKKLRKEYISQLKEVELKPGKIDKLKDYLTRDYHKSLIQPGENIGMQTAQAIGQVQTQGALNTFHKAGASDNLVDAGLNTFNELINVSQKPKIITNKVYIEQTLYQKMDKDSINESQSKDSINDTVIESLKLNFLKKTIGKNLLYIDVGKLIEKHEIIKKSDFIPAFWHKIKFEEGIPVENSEFNEYMLENIYILRLHMNKKFIYEYDIYLFEIKECIDKECPDFLCAVSPLELGIIDIIINVDDYNEGNNESNNKGNNKGNTDRNKPDLYKQIIENKVLDYYDVKPNIIYDKLKKVIRYITQFTSYCLDILNSIYDKKISLEKLEKNNYKNLFKYCFQQVITLKDIDDFKGNEVKNSKGKNKDKNSKDKNSKGECILSQLEETLESFRSYDINLQHNIVKDSSFIEEDSRLWESSQLIYNYINKNILNIIKKIYISGLSDIKELFFMWENNEWCIEVIGGAYSDILSIDFINIYKTQTTSIWDIYATMGIESVREYMIDVFLSLVPVERCHPMLLVDVMTQSGILKPISRHALTGTAYSTLTKISFEEVVPNLIKASIKGEVEPINDISSSIMTGSFANIGSGYMDVIYDDGMDEINV